MSDTHKTGLKYFVIIAEHKMKKKLLTLLGDHGAHGIDTVYAHGSMSPGAIAAAFGFEAEQNKVIITCLVRGDEAVTLMDTLYHDYRFSKPNTGIAFTVPVEGLAF